MKLDQILKRLGPITLRFFMAGVFYWFGFTQLLNSQGWVSYLPQFLQKGPFDPTLFIFLNATMEIILATFLVFGFYIRLSALILGAHLLGIAWTIGFNTSTGVRDIGLGLATFSIFFDGSDLFSVDKFIAEKKLEGTHTILANSISLMFAALAVAIVMLNYTVFSAHKKNADLISQNNQSALPAAALDKSSGEVLSTQIVAAHNKSSDCWLIISNKVYNVTQYIPFHPGGQNRIISNCGKDATVAFATKGGTGDTHSATAVKLLETYYIGFIGQQLSQTANQQAKTQTAGPPPSTSTPAPKPAVTQAPSVSLTAQAVAAHNTSSDCWLIISNKVYNVTQYIPFHPGGQNRIISNCGTDATVAFNTKGGTGSTHSANALSILAGYYVGDLNGTATTTTPTPPPPPPTRSDDD